MANALDPSIWTAAAIETEAQAILARVVARFEAARNTTLTATDVRYLILQRCARALAQNRAYISQARAVGLLRFIGADWIYSHDDLFAESPEAATASTATIRFTFASATTFTLPATRVTDGTYVWSTPTTSALTPATYVEVTGTCETTGTITNGVGVGEIDTVVDFAGFPTGFVSVTNTTQSSGGTDGETLALYRERLRSAVEDSSPAGNRRAYRRLAMDASSSVLDAVALGPNDNTAIVGSAITAGNVRILITSTGETPDPPTALTALVYATMVTNGGYPATDTIGVGEPSFVSFDVIGTYVIATEDLDQADEIQDAVEQAVLDYVTWQQAKIGRDINPDELVRRVIAAGAYRVTLTAPTYTVLKRDECALADNYLGLGYGGAYDE